MNNLYNLYAIISGEIQKLCEFALKYNMIPEFKENENELTEIICFHYSYPFDTQYIENTFEHELSGQTKLSIFTFNKIENGVNKLTIYLRRISYMMLSFNNKISKLNVKLLLDVLTNKMVQFVKIQSYIKKYPFINFKQLCEDILLNKNNIN